MLIYLPSGNTKAVAQAMAQAIGAKAISTNAPEAPLEEKADILFIGGALYAYGLDENLSAYLEALDAEKVGKAVVFSTSWISKHAGDLIKQALEIKWQAAFMQGCVSVQKSAKSS